MLRCFIKLQTLQRFLSTTSSNKGTVFLGIDSLLENHSNNFRLLNDIITKEEEEVFVEDLKPILKRKKYDSNHWDSVISFYKEIQLNESSISKQSVGILNKCREAINISTKKHNQFLSVHAIDLADNGHIGPHVDSVKFSGELVAVLSLLSDRVLTLTPDNTAEEYVVNELKLPWKDYSESYAVHLPSRSLYFIRGPLRYNYAHAVLGRSDLVGMTFEQSNVERRISIVFRDVHPKDINLFGNVA